MYRKLRTVAWVAGAFILVIAAGLGALYFAFMGTFKPAPPAPDYSKPTSALEAQRQDLDYFTRAMALDRSFSPAARAEAERRIAVLEHEPQVIPQQKLHVDLMQIAALADNGHTKVRAGIEGKTVLALPVGVARFAEGFYVMWAKAPWRDMLGGRVESIDGMPFPEVLQRLERLRGGTEAYRRENAALYISVQDLLYGSGIARRADRSDWTVRLPNGQRVSHTLVADPEKTLFAPDGLRWRSPDPVPELGRGWVSAAPRRADLPLSERNMDALFFRARVPGSCAMYVRLEAIESRPGWALQPFLSATEAAMKAHPPCGVILDLRGDGGGNYTNMWHFTHALPQLIVPGGHICLLTDPGTFSAAITTTAFTKDAGGARVTIIGEPVGDRLSFYAEGGSAVLPHSGFSLSYQTGKHDYAHPCRDWHDCYWVNWFYPVRVTTLAPAISVPARFSDWYAGRDPAFEDAVALATRSRTAQK
ncbi:MAG TPA: hypothetical protein VKR31_14535 [Rhizomicrobium sp.]|nr:hypothetical protein [Rhizomicrobium sp.]